MLEAHFIRDSELVKSKKLVAILLNAKYAVGASKMTECQQSTILS